MAITSITITQDNIVGSSNLVAVHSPVCFLADVAWTTAAPDVINVQILDELEHHIATFKAIPFSDATGVRTFAFQASLAIRSMLNFMNDFDQTSETWVLVPDFSVKYYVKFVDPDNSSTYDEVLIDFAQAVRQQGQSCNLSEIFNNESDIYLAPKDGVVYVYFYNTDEFIESVDTYLTPGTFTKTIDKESLEVDFEAYGAGGAGYGGNSTYNSFAGGAGGQYAKKRVVLDLGDEISITVAQKTNKTYNEVINGSDSYITVNNLGVCIAKGGVGGNGITGGVGSITGGVGDVVYKGGDGGAGNVTDHSGGGGGGSGSTGNGNNGLSGTGIGGSGGGGLAGKGGYGVLKFSGLDGNEGVQAGGGGSGSAKLYNIIYGKLYNWHAITNALFAPSGWHVPTQEEFETLFTYLGGNGVAVGKLKEIGIEYWDTPNSDATNETKFNGRANGYITESGAFSGLHNFCTYATTTNIYENRYSMIAFRSNDTYYYINTQHERGGVGIRFIKDTLTWVEGDILKDYDGNVYRTVKIGNQVWLADNWACTSLNDGTPIPNVTDQSAWAALTTMGYCNYDNDAGNSLETGYPGEGGEGAAGAVKATYLTTIKGFYRYKTTADQIKNITIPTIGGTLTKQVIPLDTCTGDLVLKYLDRNGQYRFYNCNKYYQTKDNPEKIGSINRFLTDLLTGQSDSYCVGYKNERIIEAVASVPTAYLDKFSDIYTSPRVYLKIGSTDLAKDWLLVEVKASDNIVRRRKGNTGLVNLTIILPEYYTISML